MDLAKTRKGLYSVVWNAFDFGAIDSVEPDIELDTDELMVGSVGKVVLGRRIIALTGTIKVVAREIDAALFQKLNPWWSSGPIGLTPATIHKDLYDYAQLLTIHPNDVDAATTEDINLLKAYPRFKPMKRDGVKDDLVEVEFEFFPDRAQIPALVYGYIGTPPA